MAIGNRVPFIGRRAELAAMQRRLELSAAGQGGLVLLAGEPGIGKTRLAEELARDADGRGHAVAWGHCYEGEGAPSFWPWAQVLRALVAADESGRIRAALGPRAAELALVVPELREVLPDLPDLPPIDPTAARFRLFEAVATFVRHAAADRPLVLVLDDLHWADVASLLLLEFMATQLADVRLLLVGTYLDFEVQPDHPLARALGGLTRRPHVERLALGSLSPDEVARFVEVTQGVQPTALLASTVLQRAEGNPLFVGEMLILLTAEQAPGRSGEPSSGPGPIPPTVREVIGRRLGYLSVGCRRVLAGAAVIGREFDLATVEKLHPADTDAVLEALDEAELARIVAPLSDVAGRYRFTHTLVRETLYDEITTNRRARLHRQVGQAIEALHEDRAGQSGRDAERSALPAAPLAELAHHFIQAAPLGDTSRALTYARLAAERAISQLAYEEGARLYGLALDLLEFRPPSDAAVRCDLLLALGTSRSRAGDDLGALDAFLTAAALARKLGAAGPLARAALGYGGVARLERGSLDERGVALLEEALARLGEADGADRARVLARLATARPWAERSARDAALSRAAVEVARRVGDRAALADALAYRCFSLPAGADPAERRALLDEIDALAAELGNGGLLVQTRRWRIQDQLEAGDVAGADATILTYGRLVEELHEPYARWRVAQVRMSRAMLEGRFDDAEQAAIEAVGLGPRQPRQGRPWFVAGELHMLRAEQGRLDEAEGLLRALATDYPANRGVRSALAWMLGEQGRADEARGELEQVAVGDLADLRDDPEWNFSVPFLAQLCATLGDRARAVALYDVLLPRAGRAIVSGITFACYGAADYHLGRLAQTLGRRDAALGHFEAAAALHARLRARPWLARTQLQQAGVLAAGGAPADAAQARELAERAGESAVALGMPRLADAARALLTRLGVGPSPTPAVNGTGAGVSSVLAVAGLTTRELEVLRLLAVGATYKEMADRLVVSRATVQSHAMSIYRKLDVRGRAEAVSYAHRHGLGS